MGELYEDSGANFSNYPTSSLLGMVLLNALFDTPLIDTLIYAFAELSSFILFDKGQPHYS